MDVHPILQKSTEKSCMNLGKDLLVRKKSWLGLVTASLLVLVINIRPLFAEAEFTPLGFLP